MRPRGNQMGPDGLNQSDEWGPQLFSAKGNPQAKMSLNVAVERRCFKTISLRSVPPHFKEYRWGFLLNVDQHTVDQQTVVQQTVVQQTL